jgi:tetrathionate reductase subunit B
MRTEPFSSRPSHVSTLERLRGFFRRAFGAEDGQDELPPIRPGLAASAGKRRRKGSGDWSLAPPAYDASLCAAGGDGLKGCRLCAESCPYGAISPLDTPEGTVMRIDPGMCERCGACTGACPTSALQRSFLPDAEVYATTSESLRDAGEDRVLLVTCKESRTLAESFEAELPVTILTLPSLLIVNETHLVHALQRGATGVALIGCPACHHHSPDLLEVPMQTARALTGEQNRLAYVEDDGSEEVRAALEGFIRSLADRESPELPAGEPVPAGETRREVLLGMLGEFETVPGGHLQAEAPFGEVEVDPDLCTMCGACSRVCPTEALSYDVEEGELSFRTADCVGCGLCEQACPERAVKLDPRARTGAALLERRPLISNDPVACRNCGKPHITKRLLEHSRRVLSRSKSPLTGSTQQIDLCPDCRSVEPERAPGGTPSGRRERPRKELPVLNGADAAPSAEMPKMSRREFLGTAPVAAGGLAALISGAAPEAAFADEQPRKKRLAMAIDTDRCIGCHACTAVCKAENDVPLGTFRDWVEEHMIGEYPDAKPYFVPKLCNQCDEPTCAKACPTGTLYMREDGIVDVNHDTCIACRACMQACPYAVPFIDPVRGTADKCNFCSHRVDQGLQPACVDICPTHCRIFGDLNDPESEISQALEGQEHQVLREDLGLGPNIKYIGLPGRLNR